jgi:hypothetical protein
LFSFGSLFGQGKSPAIFVKTDVDYSYFVWFVLFADITELTLRKETSSRPYMGKKMGSTS